MRDGYRLPGGWTRTTLGELGDYINGRGFSKAEWSNAGRPIIRIQDLTGTGDKPNYYSGEVEERYLVRPGDLLVSWAATLGAFIWQGPEGWLNQHIFKVHSRINRLFHFYLIQATLQDLNRQTHGSGMVHITRGKFDSTAVYLPPLGEQRRIVEAIEQQFTRLDAGVAALKRARVALKRYRAAVLKAAVEGRLTVAWRTENPNVEPASDLLQRILAERRAKWEADVRAKGKDPAKTRYVAPESPDTANLPALPEGWCWAGFGQCFEVHVGATPSRAQASFWNGDIPWVSSGEVQFCRVKQTREHITLAGLNNSSTQLNPAGSVLLGMIGEGRTRGQAAILDIDACNNQNCAAIWVSQTQVGPEYIYYWLYSQYDNTRRRGSGNNQPALNKSRVEEMVFPLAPLAEQEQIVAEVEQRLSIVSELEVTIEANLKRADRLRQSILERAFAGKLVPQCPDDEPASVLLERIREQREGSGPVQRNSRQLDSNGQNGHRDTAAFSPVQDSLWRGE